MPTVATVLWKSGFSHQAGSQEESEVYPWDSDVFEKLSPTLGNSWKDQFELVKIWITELKKIVSEKVFHILEFNGLIMPGNYKLSQEQLN